MTQIWNYRSTLLAMADSFAVMDHVNLRFDLNGDGREDQIDITYLDHAYEFRVRLEGHADQSFCHKSSEARETLVSLIAPLKTHPQTDWDAVQDRWPSFAQAVFSPIMKGRHATIALLLRSKTFCDLLDQSVRKGYRFVLGKDPGMWTDSLSLKITISIFTSIHDTLFLLPHEMGHIGHTDASPRRGESLTHFVNRYVMDEVKADRVALKVWKEIGIVPDARFPRETRAIYQAQSKGQHLHWRKQAITPEFVTYVERAYLMYTIRDTQKFDQALQDLGNTRRRNWFSLTDVEREQIRNQNAARLGIVGLY